MKIVDFFFGEKLVKILWFWTLLAVDNFDFTRKIIIKATIDIGGKMTRIITANFSQESHCSMVAIPKILKCYDCDKTFSRDEDFCDCKQTPYGGASGAYR